MSEVESPAGSATVPPRKLGDTWEGWSGETEENNGDLATSRWYFMSLYGTVLLMMHAIAWLFLFLAEPRLLQLGEWLVVSIRITVIAGLAALDLDMCLIVLTLLSGRNLVPYYKGKHIALSPLMPLINKAGMKIGMSKDRISNSMLQVGNVITAVNSKRIHPQELIILLPRCLTKVMREAINEIAEKYGITAHVCAGGQQARQLLAERKPKGVIAVACERDLMAGVQDVGAAIPVIAIANKRPEGPCRNTHIDLAEMENAFRVFCGKHA